MAIGRDISALLARKMKISACKHPSPYPDVAVLAAPVQARATAGSMSTLVGLALATGMLSGLTVIWRLLS